MAYTCPLVLAEVRIVSADVAAGPITRYAEASDLDHAIIERHLRKPDTALAQAFDGSTINAAAPISSMYARSATSRSSSSRRSNEGYVMGERAVFALSLWERLPADLKRHVAIDVAGMMFPRTPEVQQPSACVP